MTRRRLMALAVATLGLLISVVNIVTELSKVDWDPSYFAAFGEEASLERQYAEERLGEVFLRPAYGHDGKFFFIQANDPWLLDPERNAHFLDRPAYRSQRMLYPLLAGGGGMLGPTAILWGMLVVNVAATAIGTWVVARIAQEFGRSPLWGLAFTLNPGVISEVGIGGAGVVALAAAFAGVQALQKDEHRLAVLLLSLAVLAREVMVVVAAGTGVWLWLKGEKKRAVACLVVPTLAATLWGIYVRLRVGSLTSGSEIQEIGLPFRGFFEAFTSAWREDLFSMLTGWTVLVLLVMFSIVAIRTRNLVGLGFVGFCALGVMLTEQVWGSHWDITRAISPLFTALVLLVINSDRQRSVTGVG